MDRFDINKDGIDKAIKERLGDDTAAEKVQGVGEESTAKVRINDDIGDDDEEDEEDYFLRELNAWVVKRHWSTEKLSGSSWRSEMPDWPDSVGKRLEFRLRAHVAWKGFVLTYRHLRRHRQRSCGLITMVRLW